MTHALGCVFCLVALVLVGCEEVSLRAAQEPATSGATAPADGTAEAPTPTSSPLSARSIATGPSFSCASVADGRVACWGFGYWDRVGSPGRGRTQGPTWIEGLAGVSALAAGGDMVCAQREDETLCWRDFSGVAPFRDRRPPLPAASHMGVGGGHSCVVRGGGSVRCAGSNPLGQLGYRGWSAGRTVSGLAGVVGIALGQRHSCARLPDGRVRCWGSNASRALGTSRIRAFSPTPVDVEGLDDAQQVSATYTGAQSCALRAGGAVACWGYRPAGAETAVEVPVELPRLDDIAGIEVGMGRVFAWTQSGEAYEWLPRSRPSADSPSGYFPPARVEGPLRVIEIKAGTSHQCARAEDGRVWCWGMNTYGQLGDGDGARQARPFLVPSPTAPPEDP